jgi:hypothetical protein
MNRSFSHAWRRVALASLLVASGLSAHADEREDLETLKQTTLNLIQLLVQQGVLPAEKADLLVKEAESKARNTVAEARKTEKTTVRVQYVPESVRQQITEQVREEVVAQAKAERWGDVNAVPEWVDRFKFEGDLRLGYQRDMFADDNAPEFVFNSFGQAIGNTTEDRNRTRVRARLGISARVTPDITAGLRLTTGSSSDPVSTNQTMGNYGSKYNFALDRAFVRLNSQDTAPWLTVNAGRIANPFFGTDLLWDDDLAFDGVALQFADSTAASQTWRPFGTVGVFPLEDIQRSTSNRAKSKWMVGAQAGVEWVPSNDLRAKVGLGVYDFRNIAGEPSPSGTSLTYDTAPAFRQKGNTLYNLQADGSATVWGLASDYQVLNLSGTLDYNLYNPVHLILSADYVRNLRYDSARLAARAPASWQSGDTGYMLRAAIGMPQMLLKGDWQLSLAYRHLEADAVVDAFTDSDFHLGGTNNKGFIVGAQYGLSRNTWLSARWLSSREISGPPLSINTMQVYFHAKF